MAKKYFRRPMRHHFTKDGVPTFKYTVDPVTGKYTIDPEDAKYLDYELVIEEVPDPKPTPVQRFKNILWKILGGIFFIFVYGAARGAIHEKQKRR